MSTPIRTSERDLRALAAIVSEDRPDPPDGEGLPPSLLADLMGQIRCDGISLEYFDSERRASRFLQGIPGLGDDGLEAYEDIEPGDLAVALGLKAVQLSRAHRRPAPHHKDLRLLFNPAVACQQHVQRNLPAGRTRA